MKTLRVILLTIIVGWGTASLAQSTSSRAHPAAGIAHPAALDTHPAKADAHPAASTDIHPAAPDLSLLPSHSSDTNTSGGAVSITEPLATAALNATTPAPVEVFPIPTFIPQPSVSLGTSATTTNSTTASTIQFGQ